MVTPQPITLRRASGKVRNTLGRKLWRDMRRSGMQFIAMVLLCAIGTWCFSGLDATWREIEASTLTYFEDCRLADLWVKGAGFSKQDLTRLSHMEAVDDAQARTSLAFDAPDLGNDVSLMLHAYDGAMRINKPLIRTGETLSPSDLRGCLIEEQFANAHNLAVGDPVTLDIYGARKTFFVRGIVMSAEYIITAKDVAADPNTYGYMLVSSLAVPELPLNDVMLVLREGADANAVMDEIQQMLPSTLIISQNTHQSTLTAMNNISMFQALSYVFPVLAYAIAAMIVVSTLTRMIENQRIQMGTLKALGYRDRQIRSHYLSYALYPSLIGSVIGVVTGKYTVTEVIWPIISNTARYPARVRPPISPVSWAMAVVSVILSVLICLIAYNRAAKETTASLLRPKPPRSGSRIFLERITFLWRRFSFNNKMIVRNLMRNKGRTLLSLVGILCCNMLIICTFGLTDSFTYFIGEYYGGTLAYDVRADLNTTAGTLESYQARLDAEKVEGVMEVSVNLHAESESRASLLTIIPEEQVLTRLGENRTLIDLPRDGVVISRKLCEVMDIAVGDTIELTLTGDTESLSLQVAGMAETYIGQGVFMSRRAWEDCRKGAFMPTALLLNAPTDMCIHRLHEMDEVTGLKYPPKQFTETLSVLDSANAAFSVLSAAALLLAFIICYNMGLMNFTERTRDYATLKVLGYHQREIRRLMLRENNVTALTGVLIGIPPGVYLTRLILKTCEYDSMVFAPHVTMQSIVLASVITFVFTYLIEWVLTRKVRAIDMVEALKSVE
ncbi:MAG: ABC transporter permease [Clostridia bacterium]|nr:ABC transporter permease [Clostridia bacterium]